MGMIDDLKGLAVFVAVADAGSFSAAGRRLRLSTSVISHHVGKLEEKLGASLFFRSTRSLSLTPEGAAMLVPARRMISAGEEAFDLLSDRGDELIGALRVTMPVFGDNIPVLRAVWEFAAKHPLVKISLNGSDQQVDLIKDGYDLAIRLGRLRDSALKSRKVGEFHRVLVGAPQYLQDAPAICSPDDLFEQKFVSLVMLPDVMTLEKGKDRSDIVQEKISAEVNSISAAKAAVKAGLGLQVLPSSEVEQELECGQLIHVLPQWQVPAAGVYAVWPDIGPQKRLTRRLIEHLATK